jgi:tetratricopeptide (TPR) repeat protein
MSLLMDALKKADEAKKKPLVTPSVEKVTQDSANTNQDPSAITEAQDLPASDEDAKDLRLADKEIEAQDLPASDEDAKDLRLADKEKEEEEELFLFEITDDDNLSATAVLTEPTLVAEDENDFALITATNEPFLTDFQQPQIELEAKNSWDNEFLPEFQQELEQLENSNVEVATTIEEPTTQLNEFTAYDEQELVQPQLAESLKEIAVAKGTQKPQPSEFNPSNLDNSQEQSALTPIIPPLSSRQQASNGLSSLPKTNKFKPDTTTTTIDEADVSILAEPEIEQELVRIEQVTQTKPDEQSTPHIKSDEQPTPRTKSNEQPTPRAKPDAQVAQRILAAHTPPAASSTNKRTWWLGGFLGVLLIIMGGGYYYYTQSSLVQPSGLKFGQLNQRLRTNSLSTPPVAEEAETLSSSPSALPLPPPNQTEPQPTVAQTQSHVPQVPHEINNQTTTPVQKPPLSEIPAPDPVKPANPIKNNDSPTPTTISADDLFADKKIRTEIAKLVADEIAKQFAAQMTKITAKLKANQSTATTAPTAPKSTSATQTRLPPNKSRTAASVPTKSTPVTTEKSTQIPNVQKNLTEKITKGLSSAYKNFHQGNEKLAYETYRQILQQDPNNRDALLGFAALAVRHGNMALARQYYQQVLQFYPQDPHAQVGLINTLNYQPASSESQLKLLLANSPHSAHIHFSLGNLYANQGRWAQAQQAYFDAYRYDSSQADYAYNLAISLDQLNQSGAALNYYQQALQLARNQRSNFNQAAVQKRVQTLMAHKRPSALDNLAVKFE